jgi:hypothetical protein
MKAYVVITAKAGTAREIADAMTSLPGMQMADACWRRCLRRRGIPGMAPSQRARIGQSALDSRRDPH